MLRRHNLVLNRSLSCIGFGGAALSGEGGGYGFGPLSESEAEVLIKTAEDSGINLFDTAPIYGFGLSEERLGRYLSADSWVVTKGGVDWHGNRRVNMSNDPAIIEKMFLASLERLRRERIDIYMIHWPDPRVDIRRPLEVLRRFQEQGLIGYIGLCNTNLADLQKAAEIVPIRAIQSELNALNDQAFELLSNDWKKYFSMAWGTFDKGILSGRVSLQRNFEKTDCRSWAPWWNKKDVGKKIDRVARLEQILTDYDLSLASFALHFNLTFFGVNTTLIGVKNVDDLLAVTSSLQENVSSVKIKEILQRWM